MDVKTLRDMQANEWPPDADQVLVRTIRDRDADVAGRVLAVQLAGDMVVINDQLANLLLDLIRGGDEADEVRAAAAIALGPVLEHGDVDGFDDPDDVPISEPTFRTIQDAMREVYAAADLPKEVRRRVLEGSVRAPRKWHARAVREAHGSDDPDWRLTAVFCMEYVRGFEQQILEALASDDQNIRYHALLAAGNWGLDEAWHDVARLLESADTDKPFLLAAIEAAVGIRPDEAEGLIEEHLESEDEDIAGAAQVALAMADALCELDYDEDDGDLR